MDFLDFIKESSPKLNKILETEYQNYLNFQKPLEFLKVGHIYECNSIRYGGGGGRFIITAVAPYLKKGCNISDPEPIYHIISLNELDEYDPREDEVHWESIDKIYEMVLTDVTDEYKDNDKIFNWIHPKQFWEFYWDIDKKRIFKVHTLTWSYSDGYWNGDRYKPKRCHHAECHVQPLYVDEVNNTIETECSYSLIRLGADNTCWCVDTGKPRIGGYCNGRFEGKFNKRSACSRVIGVPYFRMLDKVFKTKEIEYVTSFKPYPFTSLSL